MGEENSNLKVHLTHGDCEGFVFRNGDFNLEELKYISDILKKTLGFINQNIQKEKK